MNKFENSEGKTKLQVKSMMFAVFSILWGGLLLEFDESYSELI